MINFIKKYYSPFILSILLIVSVVFLVLSIHLVEAKVWVLYSNGKREVIEIQTSNNGQNILEDVQPTAYYLGYVSIAMFALMSLLITTVIAYKVALKMKHKTSPLHISWQFKVVFALLISLAIFFFAFSTHIHFNLPFEEWKKTQTHLW